MNHIPTRIQTCIAYKINDFKFRTHSQSTKIFSTNLCHTPTKSTNILNTQEARTLIQTRMQSPKNHNKEKMHRISLPIPIPYLCIYTKAFVCATAMHRTRHTHERSNIYIFGSFTSRSIRARDERVCGAYIQNI